MNFIDLLEGKDLRPALIKAGYTEQMAEYAHKVNSKYAGFVAKASFGPPDKWDNPDEYFKQMATKGPRITAVIQQLFQNNNKPQLKVKPQQLTLEMGENLVQELTMMRDWWEHPSVEGIVPQRMSWDDALHQARDWYAAQRENAGGELAVDEGQDIVHQFDDKTYWLCLNTDFDRDEGDAMGHCGRSDGDGVLYSYRDVRGTPHLTADIFEDKKLCGQVYAKGNSKPPSKYHRIILTLIGNLGLESIRPSSHGDRSFAFDDISAEDLEWFDETYGYELTPGGCTQEMIDEAQEIVNTYDWRGPVTAWADFSSMEEYVNCTGSLRIDLDNFVTTAKYNGDWRHQRAMIEGVFDYGEVDVDGDRINVDFHEDGGYFNTEEGTGNDGHQHFDDIVEWAKSCCISIDYYNTDYTYENIVPKLVSAGIIDHQCPLGALFCAHSEDEEFEAIEDTLPNISSIDIKSENVGAEGTYDWKTFLKVAIWFPELQGKSLDQSVLEKVLIQGVAKDAEQLEFDFVEPEKKKEPDTFKHLDIEIEGKTIIFKTDVEDADTLFSILQRIHQNEANIVQALNGIGSDDPRQSGHFRQAYGLGEARLFLNLF